MPSSSPSPSPPAPLVQSPVKRQSSSQKRNSDQYESANSGSNSVESSSGSAGVGGEKTPLSSNVTESRRRSNFNVVPIQAQDMRDFGPYQHIKKGSMGGANQMSNGTPRGRAGSNSTGGSNTNSNKSTSPIGQQHQQLAVPLLPRNGNGNHQNMLNSKRSSAVSANSAYSSYPSHSSHEKSPGGGGADLVWDSKDPEMDDYLHNPDPIKDKKRDCGWSTRGLVNVAAMSIVITGLLALFAGYPLISHFTQGPSDGTAAGFNIGGTNGSGQVPDIPNLAQLIDPDTPPSAQTYKSSVSGDSFHIVFSDEFETEGRTFWPGDDPYWEAVDLWYGGTGDYEWYSPEAVNTTGGALVIEMTEQATHNLNFQSGMVQSWNKFCFTGGYLEFSAILPGNVGARGYWPGLWTMGNLGRPGYLGSTDGMWPYSYNSCDTGTLKNQTFANGTGPAEALRATAAFSGEYDHRLSFLPGQRTSACTCSSSSSEHPGPNVNVGRSAPELDVLEAQVHNRQGQASQSLQIAPFDPNYTYGNTSATTTFYDPTDTVWNSYTGGAYQEAVSALSTIPDKAYEGYSAPEYTTFGMEYSPDYDGNGSGTVTWFIDGKATWHLTGASVGPRPEIDISQRLVPVEPMSIIMNLGISKGFQTVYFDELTFPAQMKVDYVRVYQRDGDTDQISCDPPNYPTAKYIENHLDLYMNPNYTVFPRDKYDWPANRLETSC